jgi:two-component system, NarL family, invasion response regulator UvrY
VKWVLIVDDHPMLRKGLVDSLLQGFKDQQMNFDEAGCGEDALVLATAHRYDLAIVDISMPGMDGFELLKTFRQSVPKMPVLMLSMFSEDQFAFKAFRLGAAGYLTKKEAAAELITAVRHILTGKRYLSQPLSNALLEQTIVCKSGTKPSHAVLSDRELGIMQRLATGQTLKSIADELHLSLKTVSTYKRRLFSKMGFSDVPALIYYATTNKLSC